MNSFCFDTREELENVVRSGLIPQHVLQSPAVCRCGDDGRLLVHSGQKLKKADRQKLQTLGLLCGRDDGRAARVSKHREEEFEVTHWAEFIVPRRRHAGIAEPGLVLFRFARAQQLQAVSHELLRLGCDRQSFFSLQLPAGERLTLLRVLSPPYFTLLKALDDTADVTVYEPVRRGQEGIWIELGFGHPVLEAIDCATDRLVLIGGEGDWEYLPQAEWTRLYDSIDISIDASINTSINTGSMQTMKPVQPPRIQVGLRLVENGREQRASLWLIHDRPLQTVEALVARLPDSTLSGISFAVVQRQERTMVVLKRRAHWHKELFLDLPAECCTGCAPWGGLENLYLPDNAVFEPPLRSDRLAGLLAPDPEMLTIVTAAETAGAVDVYRVAHQDFQLLEHWVDYVISQNSRELEPWIMGCSFDFAEFESIGMEWTDAAAGGSGSKTTPKASAAGPQRVAARRSAVRRRGRRQAAGGDRPAVGRQRSETGYQWTELFSEPVHSVAEEERLRELEREFIALDEPAGSEARVPLWEQMAACNARLHRPGEAGQCWVRLLWPGDEGDEIIAQWLALERSLLGVQEQGRDAIDRLLAVEAPSVEQVRLFALELIAASGGCADPAAVRQWLVRHESVLDVRTLWLAWLRFSQASGDLLQLVDARDRILARLRGGLSLEKDIPAFMRFCGSQQGDMRVVHRLQQELSKLLSFYSETKRNRETLEADTELTDAYVHYVFAWGFARLNQPSGTDVLLARARRALDLDDPVHRFLSAAYEARVQQARDGAAVQTPLPEPLLARLDDMGRLQRFKIEQVMKASKILAPQSRPEPFKAFCSAVAEEHSGMVAADLYRLKGTALLQQIDRVLHTVSGPEAEHDGQAEVFEAVLGVLTQVGEAELFPRLEQILDRVPQMPPLSRCSILETALLLAGFYFRGDIISRLIVEIDGLTAEADGEDLGQVADMLSQFVSSLRRVGMIEQGLHILEKIYDRFRETGTAGLVARIHIASGFAEMGRQEMLEEVFEEAGGLLADPGSALNERLSVSSALAQATGCMQHDRAVVRIHDLARQLVSISDNLSTNSHLCLSVVSFVESLVLGLCSDKLVLGDLGGRWLGEDEFLVRERIQRDLQTIQQ